MYQSLCSSKAQQLYSNGSIPKTSSSSQNACAVNSVNSGFQVSQVMSYVYGQQVYSSSPIVNSNTYDIGRLVSLKLGWDDEWIYYEAAAHAQPDKFGYFKNGEILISNLRRCYYSQYLRYRTTGFFETLGRCYYNDAISISYITVLRIRNQGTPITGSEF